MKTIKRASNPRVLGWFLFLVAFFVRAAIIVHFRPYDDLKRYELEKTAISLAQTGVYGNPYAVPTGPTGHVSPGYTLILAGIFHMFGTGIHAEIIKELLSTAVTSLAVALLPFVAMKLSLSSAAGIAAGLVMALYPARPLVEIDGDWETPYMVLALMLIALMAVYVATACRLTPRGGALHGLWWGIALLFVSALLPLFVVFVVAGAVWQCKQT